MLGPRGSAVVPSIGARPCDGRFIPPLCACCARSTPTASASRSHSPSTDTADQLTLVRRCIARLQMNDESISRARSSPRNLERENELIGRRSTRSTISDFFRARVGRDLSPLPKRLRPSTTPMDFDDLIGKYVSSSKSTRTYARSIHSRFQHLLVRRVQDTNRAQYGLIRALAGRARDIVARRRRGPVDLAAFAAADINTSSNFERDFPRADHQLEQTLSLHAATSSTRRPGVVANNIARKGKRLFTEGGSGEPVRIVTASTIAKRRSSWLERSPAMRRAIPAGGLSAVPLPHERAVAAVRRDMLRANMPYSVVGRCEVLRARRDQGPCCRSSACAVAAHDTPSIERVINVPSRGHRQHHAQSGSTIRRGGRRRTCGR